jgi:hypothetical protein
VVSFKGCNAVMERVAAAPSATASVGSPAVASAPAAPPSAAPATREDPVAVVEPANAALSVETNLDLPPNLVVGPDKGLLDIDTGAAHSIYVDDVFVGRGPQRRVPLRAGKHHVRLRLEGGERTTEVTVQTGRRTRLVAPGEP